MSEKTDKTQNENEVVYYAKSASAVHGPIENRDHLRRVGELAGVFGDELGIGNEARIAGMFHDFGKYSDRFQSVLRGTMQGVDHAFPGAAFLFAYKRLNAKKASAKRKKYEPIIEAVQGHHDGLVSLAAMEREIGETLRFESADCCPSGKLPSLAGEEEYQAALLAFLRDFPEYEFSKIGDCRVGADETELDMLDTRMLFSCLVDADYSVSAADDDLLYLERNSRATLDFERALEKLEAHCANLRANSAADPELNLLRGEVYDACGRAGEHSPGLFTLTAPTGLGKTVAMLNFALRHCIANSMRRIIVVLPFLALAEQTEREYRHVFDEVLTDHSQSDLSDEVRELAARWDAPVIITTSVRFFESLFSDKPTDCRKLHSIAGSVVLFDEAQSLPAELARPTVRAVSALCEKYRCTMVFSTATQPCFDAIPGVEWNPQEILPDNARLFEATRRVRTEWRLAKNGVGKTALSDIASEMSAETNACCVVNLRRHAAELFSELERIRGTRDGLFFLTTDMCPAHRLCVVDEIRRRQKSGEECLVVSTQCIEAGVDLDFDVMYRALAPLEAIVQAAGRCNRNRRLPDGGKVVVFEPEDERRPYPDESYEQAARTVKELWADRGALELGDASVIAEYYGRYFSRTSTKKPLERAIGLKDYRETAVQYRLIKNSGVRLIVLWEGRRQLFDTVSRSVQDGSITVKQLYAAAPIMVTSYDEEGVRSCATSITFRKHGRLAETGWFILNRGFEENYDQTTGFRISGNMDKFFVL